MAQAPRGTHVRRDRAEMPSGIEPVSRFPATLIPLFNPIVKHACDAMSGPRPPTYRSGHRSYTSHQCIDMYIVCNRAQQGSLAVVTQTSNALQLGEDSQLRWQGAVQGIRVGLQGPGTCNMSTALLWVSNSHREGERPLSRATAYVPCRHLLPQGG